MGEIAGKLCNKFSFLWFQCRLCTAAFPGIAAVTDSFPGMSVPACVFFHFEELNVFVLLPIITSCSLFNLSSL